MDEQLEQRVQFQQESTAASDAAAGAQQGASRQLQERLENPEFFAQLRDIDVDTDEFDTISDILGPLQSGAHLIANRSEDYERESKWLDRNRAERIATERDPGRLCKGKTRELATRAHEHDRDVKPEWSSDQRRAIRDALEAVTNYKSLGIETAGLSSVTEATAVSRVERNEEETKSRAERAADIL